MDTIICDDSSEAGRAEVEATTGGDYAVALGGSVHGTIDLLCDCAAGEENSITVEWTEGALSLQAWRRLVSNPSETDERVITEEPGETTLTLIEEVVTDIEGENGDLVSFEEATRVGGRVVPDIQVVVSFVNGQGSPRAIFADLVEPIFQRASTSEGVVRWESASKC